MDLDREKEEKTGFAALSKADRPRLSTATKSSSDKVLQRVLWRKLCGQILCRGLAQCTAPHTESLHAIVSRSL